MLCTPKEICSTLMKILVIFCNEIGILNIDIININLDNNFDEDDPDGGIFEFQKMRKKKQNQFLLSNAFNVYSIEILGHFDT